MARCDSLSVRSGLLLKIARRGAVECGNSTQSSGDRRGGRSEHARGARSTPDPMDQRSVHAGGTRSRAGPADARSSMQVEAALQARASRRGARPTALREAVRVAAGRAVIGPSDSRGSTRAQRDPAIERGNPRVPANCESEHHAQTKPNATA